MGDVSRTCFLIHPPACIFHPFYTGDTKVAFNYLPPELLKKRVADAFKKRVYFWNSAARTSMMKVGTWGARACNRAVARALYE